MAAGSDGASTVRQPIRRADVEARQSRHHPVPAPDKNLDTVWNGVCLLWIKYV